MAQARTRVLIPSEPAPEALPDPIDLMLPEDTTGGVSMQDGARKIELPDGSVSIDLNPDLSKGKDKSDSFYENLVEKIDEGELARIANELLSAIDLEDQSRKEWLETRARGITLLGLKVEDPRSDTGTASAPLEGMSTVRHPLLLEAVLRFQANARGELLPASGPVKVRNDTPVAPRPLKMGHNGGPTMEPAMPQMMPPQMGAPPMPGMSGNGPVPSPVPQVPMPPPPPPLGPVEGMSSENEELAQALETDMNHYLTSTATEYYPDTDRMLFYVGFGGSGFKKVYNCPLRQRPVSESVDAADIIVSNAASDLGNVGRLTHRIKMRPSILKRMQLIGAYRDVLLAAASSPSTTVVEQKVAEIQGVKPQTMQRPSDTDQEIYETYCELDIQGFEHKEKGEPTGLQLPYKVTLHKESSQVLEVRRNWDKNDKQCLPKEYFVDFPFVRGLGFYGIGLIHILGNTTNALTAAWRELIDVGMFANFPGFIYAKQLGRQLTNQFRVPPGGGIPLDIGTGKIQDNVMALPYKDVGSAFVAFITHVEEVGQRVGGTADIAVGEGKQEAPVGTTLALIEQATKVMDAVHKNLHAAQAREFKLLKERFREDPEAFWRHNKKPAKEWKKEQFIQALNDCDLVPVADPNNPTSLHRIAKATALKVLQKDSPQLYDPMAVDQRIMRITGIDPTGLFLPKPAPPPPDPRFAAIKSKADAQAKLAEIQELQARVAAASKLQQIEDNKAERASRERIEQMKLELQKMRLTEESIIHAHDFMAGKEKHAQDLQSDAIKHTMKLGEDRAKHAMKIQADKVKHEQSLKAKKNAPKT